MKLHYLDWIRTIAIVGVLYGHLVTVASYAPSIAGVIGEGKSLPIIPSELHRMNFLDSFLVEKLGTASAVIGVVLFFWLAGYLAAMTRDKYKDGEEFYLKRCTRIFPGLILAMLVVIPIAYGEGYSYSYWGVLFNILLLQQLVGYPTIIGALWTLVVEYYFDIVAMMIPRFTAKRIIILELLILFVVIFQALEQNQNIRMFVYSVRFIPQILFGAMIYCVTMSTRGGRLAYLTLSGVLAYLTIFISIHYTFTFDAFYKTFSTYAVTGLIWFCFYYLDKLEVGFVKQPNKFIQYIVDTSYLVFLLQLNVGLTFMYYLKEKMLNPYIIVAGGVLATYFVATVLHYFFERRIGKLSGMIR